MVKIIYVLIGHISNDASPVLGVFSSKRLAEEAQAKIHDRDFVFDGIEILEIKLDEL